MSHTTTTVVTRQVTSSGGTTHVTTGNRDWNTGVLSCAQDCKSCTYYSYSAACNFLPRDARRAHTAQCNVRSDCP